MKSKSGVYQIKNKINGKLYIGSTMSLSVRKDKDWHRLKIGVHPNRRLQSDYRRYGRQAFTFEVIEFVENKLDLIEREKFYIDSNDWADLYNVVPEEKTVNKICLKTGKILQSYTSIKEAGSANGISPSGISIVIAGRAKSSGGYYWTYAE